MRRVKTNLIMRYLKIRFALAAITLAAGLLGGVIALFQWVERTGVQYLFGDYSRYILGFASFGAMIFGAALINDTWIHWRVTNGKYKLPIQASYQARIIDFIEQKTPGEKHD
jgi:hypothetical protein